MKVIKFFLFFLSLNTAIAQEITMQKSIITDDTILVNLERSGHLEVSSVLTGESLLIDTSVYLFGLPTQEEREMAGEILQWDIVGSYLFQNALYKDSRGACSYQIRRYSIDSLRGLRSDALKNYIVSTETLFDNDIQPGEWYQSRIFYAADSITGPLFFDFVVNKDSLIMYIYLEGLGQIEVWNYNRYRFKLGHDKDQLEFWGRKKNWEKVNSITLNHKLKMPFRVLSNRSNIFLISDKGSIYSISGGKLQLMKTASKITGGYKIIDKKGECIYLIPNYAKDKPSWKEGLIPANKVLQNH
ncbi:MAG: hypothetical protein R2792_06625 [Saprospiraceae bacterium]